MIDVSKDKSRTPREVIQSIIGGAIWSGAYALFLVLFLG